MRASHTRGKVLARFDDRSVVSHAGLVPLLRLTENVGFADLATERIRVPGPAGANPDAKLLSIVAGMAAGADSIDDLDVLRTGATTTPARRAWPAACPASRASGWTRARP